MNSSEELLSDMKVRATRWTNGEHLVIEVKTTQTNLDVDRLRAVAETVTSHPGWRFLLVTDAERMPLPEVGSGAEPLTLAQTKQRLTRVD